MFDHFFGGVEVRNHTVAHWADGFNAARGAAQHQLGIFAYRQDLLFAIFDMIGHNRGFIQDDPAPFDVDQRVGCPKVDRHV